MDDWGTPQPPPDQPPDDAPGADPNRAAVSSAGLAPDTAAWLAQVAGQVDPRLDRVSPSWRDGPQADAARALAFGLLLGQLASLYPHTKADLSLVAEAHASFANLGIGSRLDTLEELAGDRARMAAWIGPLLGATDPAQVAQLLDA